MPYSRSRICPKGRSTSIRPHQKHAFLKAFNNALDEYHDESRAFAVAHSAAKKAPRTDPDEERSG